MPTDPIRHHTATIVAHLASVGQLSSDERAKLATLVSQFGRTDGAVRRCLAGVSNFEGCAITVGDSPIAYAPGVQFRDNAAIIDQMIIKPDFERRGLKCLTIPHQLCAAFFSAPYGVPIGVHMRPTGDPNELLTLSKYGLIPDSNRFCEETGLQISSLDIAEMPKAAAIILAASTKKVAETVGENGQMTVTLRPRGTMFQTHFHADLKRISSGQIGVMDCEAVAPYQFVKRQLDC